MKYNIGVMLIKETAEIGFYEICKKISQTVIDS